MPAHRLVEFLARLDDQLLFPGVDTERVKSELADHVLSRVDELETDGCTPDEAWAQAESELGDLDELVELEQQVDWRTKRRIWMRFTTLTIIGGFVATVMVMSSWPENSRLAMMPRVSGQDDPFSEESALSDDEAVNNRRTEAKLMSRLDAEFDEIALRECLGFLAAQLDLNIYVDRRSLEDYGIASDEPVTLHLKDVRASMILELILQQLELSYTIRDGIVTITTHEQIEEQQIVKVYNVRNLLQQMSWSYGPGPGGMGSPMGPGNMMEGMMGGGRAPSGYGSGMMGSGPRGGGSGNYGAGSGGGSGYGPGHPGASAGGGSRAPEHSGYGPAGSGGGSGGYGPASGGAPAASGSGGFPSAAEPRRSGAGYPGGGAGSQGGGNGSGDNPFEAGNSSDPEADPFGQGSSVAVVPRWILAQMGMGGGGLGGMGGGMGGYPMGSGSEPPQPLSPEDQDLHQLMEIIVQTVEPNSWEDVGGRAKISGMNGLLVVRQSYDVHLKIEDLLRLLESAVGGQPQPGGFF